MNKQIYQVLVKILVDITGNSPEEITLESDLQEDLGIELDVGFSKLINEINYQFQQQGEDLELDADNVLDLLEEYGFTVGELAKIVDEELALG